MASGSKQKPLIPLAKALGNRLRAMRLERGLSQEALAERANLSLNAVGSFERGQRFPRAGSIEAILQALDHEPDPVIRSLLGEAPAPLRGPAGDERLPTPLPELLELLRPRSEADRRLIYDLTLRILAELDR